MEELKPIRPIGEVYAYSGAAPLCSMGLQGSSSDYGIILYVAYSPNGVYTEFQIVDDWLADHLKRNVLYSTSNYDKIIKWCEEHHDEIIQQCKNNLEKFKKQYN